MEEGSREAINVAIPENLGMFDLENITRGLQIIIRVGRTVSGTLQLCGAAGRVQMLDSVR